MRFFNRRFSAGDVKPTVAKNAACFIAAASVNVGMLYAAKREADKNRAWYLRLSPEQQKEVYNNCPEQKFGNSGDAIGAMFLNLMAHNPELHKHIPPIVPYEESVGRHLTR